jgi:hypothetical protein
MPCNTLPIGDAHHQDALTIELEKITGHECNQSELLTTRTQRTWGKKTADER